MIKHSLAVAAIMAATARKLRKDEQLWELTGLLHDIDYELTSNRPAEHGKTAADMLAGKVPEQISRAIIAHNYEYTRIMPKSQLELALIAADAISGLLIASALVMPSKKLADVKLKSIKEKFKSKDFARAVNRSKIALCSKFGIQLDDYLHLALGALQSIAGDLGL
jgi:hypothetical protein